MSYFKFLIFLLLALGVSAFRRQSAAVKGRVLCGRVPQAGVLVKLFDEDDGPDPDDLLDTARTDENGAFSVAGDTIELTNIDPEVRIYHSCNNYINPCPREWVLKVPDKYISSGGTPKVVMDMGSMNLEVTGRLFCGDRPAEQVRVKLVDDDFGPDPDDDLDSGYTDAEGYFDLSGDTTELTTIDPHLKIYHDCNDGLIPCQRRWKFELPNSYITSGRRPTKTLDIGTWNLETKMPEESHDWDFGTNNANFAFDVLVISDSTVPMTSKLDYGVGLTVDSQYINIPNNTNTTIPGSANYIGVFADPIFVYSKSHSEVVLRTPLVQLNMMNITDNFVNMTVSLNSYNTSIYGSITFSYRFRCASTDTYGVNCTRCIPLNSSNGVCYNCNDTTGLPECCDGYDPPYCIIAGSTTTNSYWESTTTTNDKKLKNIFFWVMIGLGIIVIILLILLIICCIMARIYKNQVSDMENKEQRRAARQQSSYHVQSQIVESPKQSRPPPPQNYESRSPHMSQNYESRNSLPPPQNYEVRNPPSTTFPRTAPHHPRNVVRQRYPSGSSDEWNYVTGREDDQQRQVAQQQRYQSQGTFANSANGLVQQGYQQQSPYGQNSQNQGSSPGGQPGLLSNPVRDTQSRSLFNGSYPANFYFKIDSYQNSRWQISPDGSYCNPPSSCSFAFTLVIASIDGSVVYNSTNFYSVGANTGQLVPGDWTSPQVFGLATKPISVDIFVHSLTFSDGYANGSKYIFNAPVSHVDTFVLNLLRIQPTLAAGSPSPMPMNLVGQRLSTSLQISYYVQCNNGYLGEYCDLNQCINGTDNTVICVSTVTGDHRLCNYDFSKTQVQNCTFCDFRYGNNSCANIYYANASVGVAHAYKVWTIVLACLFLLALLIILLLVCLKICGDRRNRQAQQFPQNRQPSAYSGGYRPNAGSGNVPLLGNGEKEWERPAIIRRPHQATIPEEASTQNSESFQETRPYVPHSQQQRREAQV
ncbi:hypothetical protein FO519_002476 [Halicephalobus sp. NKZ332]|nr:hypothetical protein FO519_002476 [Halicephalobus sp. NKZ332]